LFTPHGVTGGLGLRLCPASYRPNEPYFILYTKIGKSLGVGRLVLIGFQASI
jgi:hypothetical protein